MTTLANFNQVRIMKKLSSIIIAAGALLAVSCSKEANFSDPVAEENLIDITVIASEKPAAESEDTKTYIDGTSVKWSDSGEKLKVFEVATPTEGDVVTTQATTAEGVTSDSGATMSFGVTLAGKSEGYSSFDYYAVYPSSAYQTGSAVTGIALNTKGAQTPTATNFDATADLLIAKKIENGATQASTLEMQFARVVAIGKMTIKNLESTDPITKITFSAKVGEEAVALAGRTNFNLETAKPVSTYASNTQDHAIILNYEGQNITANTSAGMVAYFTCYPFAINSETPGSFKVVVETATQSFTKEVSVSSAKGLAFNIGKASVFSVNMDGITGETKEVDLRFAYLDYEDFTDNGGGTSSYGNVTANKTHGDSWVMYAIGTNNAIGVRRNDNGTNDSYIKLPDFKEDIKTVIVTLKNATAAKTITLESSASASNGSIASLTTTEASVYTFDLTSTSVKTAYFRSSGFQAQVEKIEVYAGEDNRTKLSAPTSVVTALNSESTNSIDVSWNAVDNAGSYVVTLVPGVGDAVTYVSATTSCTVEGLEYDTEYLIAVKAIPADPYIYKESDDADGESVETGSASGPEWVKTDLADIADGSLVVIVDETTAKAMSNNGGTSSAPSATAISISADKSKLSAAPAETLQWVLGKSSSSYTFKVPDTSNYLYVTATNNGVRVGAGDRNEFEAYDNSGVTFLKNTADTDDRYIGVYNSQDWRCYTSINNNIKNTVTVFYVLADSRPEAPISWSDTEGYAEMTESGTDTSLIPSFTNSESLEVVFATTDATVADINETTGAITIVGAGTATISATFTAESSSAYKTTVKSFELEVEDNRPTVGTPSFSPVAGEVAANTVVTISTATAGATIYYTTDSSAEFSTSTWTQGNTVTIDAAKTIRAVAVKDNYKNSAEASAAYTVAGASTTHYYTKVTSTAGITSGDYLIVYETGEVAFNGGLETLDATSNTVSVSIDVNNRIEATSAMNAAKFTIDVTAGTILSASGKYIGVSSNSNGLKQTEESSTYTHSFEIDDDGNASITASFSGSTMSLRYNSSTGQERFRYYKNAGQKAIQLYKYN